RRPGRRNAQKCSDKREWQPAALAEQPPPCALDEGQRFQIIISDWTSRRYDLNGIRTRDAGDRRLHPRSDRPYASYPASPDREVVPRRRDLCEGRVAESRRLGEGPRGGADDCR